MGACRFRGFYYFLFLHIILGISDILSDRSFKQPCILKNHTESVAQFFPWHIRDLSSVHFDRSVIYLIKAHQKIDQRCFSRSGRSYYRNFLPRFYRQIDPVHQKMIRRISERHIFKCNATAAVIRYDALV